MSIPLTINGVTFLYPQTGNSNWGAATTAWASAVTTGMLSKAGGTFTLTGEVDFGASFGLKSIVYKSGSTNIAQSGLLRQSNSDLITWRNGANSADNTLGVNSSNELLYNGLPVGASFNVSDTPTINLDFADNELTADIVDNSITNIHINTNADIDVSKLANGDDGYVLLTDGTTPTWKPIPVSNTDHIVLNDDNQIGFEKSIRKHFFFEEFDFAYGADPSFLVPIHFGNSSWFFAYQNDSDAYLDVLAAENGHPGIIKLVTGPTANATAYLTRGYATEGGNFFPYYVNNVDQIDFIIRANTTTEPLTSFMIGLADSQLSNFTDNKVVFQYDGYTISAICETEEGGGSETSVDTEFDPGTQWVHYRIIQNPIGTFNFYINGTLEATINTDVPSTASLAIYMTIDNDPGGVGEASMDIDYVSVSTLDLGNRFD